MKDRLWENAFAGQEADNAGILSALAKHVGMKDHLGENALAGQEAGNADVVCAPAKHGMKDHLGENALVGQEADNTPALPAPAKHVGMKDHLGENTFVGQEAGNTPALPAPAKHVRMKDQLEKNALFGGANHDEKSGLGKVELHSAPSGILMGPEEDGKEGDDYPPIKSFMEFRYICWIESAKLWSIAAPIAFNILCNYGIQSFTNIFVGHIGDVELSAVAISLSVFGSFAFGFMLGMGSALETLCGQAYGAGQIQMLGVYMQRSWIILFGSCFILLPLYIFATPILKLLGQEADIAKVAGKFTIHCLPQLFSLAINFPTQKFLQAQSKVGIMAYIGFVALILHTVMLYLFIEVFGWSLFGAAWAYNISAWGIALAQSIFIIGWCKDAWPGFSWLAFHDIWPFVRLSVASAVMICLEVWYFMSIIVLTGHLQDPLLTVGSLSICMNVNGWEGMLYIGINAAISVRVSNELGSGHPRAAKYAVVITVAQSLCIGTFLMCTIMLTKNHFAVIFTDSQEIRVAVAHLAYLLGITLVLNSVQPVISGVAVGGGWQGLVAYINLFCYYVVGLPLGFLLGYTTSLGVEGIWIGMICGTSLQTLILIYIVYKTNWNKEVEQASERMRIWGSEVKDLEDEKVRFSMEMVPSKSPK